MDIIDPDIERYLNELAGSDDPVLQEMEVLAAERSFPFVGPQVGRLLALLARSSGAQRVLELGSGFGYSAYWFARAVGPGGHVILTESSSELAERATDFLDRAGFADRTRIVVGDALEIADSLGAGFDIVFNDVDKHQYPQVLEKAAAVLRPGGLFISDNMLWFGTVLEKRPQKDSTRGVQELTRRLYASDEFDTVVVPVRDGVSISTYHPRPADA